MQNSGEIRRENAQVCLSAVIARSQRVRPFGRPDDRLRESRRRGSALLRRLAPRNDSSRDRNAATSSSWRTPGPITPGLCSCDDRPPPNNTDRLRGMAPGFRQDDSAVDPRSRSNLAPAQERQPFEQMHILLVLEERAVQRRNQFARIALPQHLRRDVFVEQKFQPVQKL